MSRKSRFEIASELIEGGGTDVGGERRLGPMATAIRETAESVKREQEETQFDELAALRLAARMKKLLDADLDLRTVQIDLIDRSYLTRDRKRIDTEALNELKASIAASELRTPIRLEEAGDGSLFLVEGWRRLRAFEGLLSETGDERYTRIPALVRPVGSVDKAYRSMVDENLVREDVTFGELASLAMAYSDQKAIAVEAAVDELFASASRQKRWTIREFAKLFAAAGGEIRYPEAISKHLGVALAKRVGEADFPERMRAALQANPARDAASEVDCLEKLDMGASPKSRSSGSRQAPAVKFRIRLDGGKGRRFDVAASGKRLVIAGVEPGEVSEAAVRRFLESLG